MAGALVFVSRREIERCICRTCYCYKGAGKNPFHGRFQNAIFLKKIFFKIFRKLYAKNCIGCEVSVIHFSGCAGCSNLK